MTEVPEYHEVAATRIMRDLPRFGHTSTFSHITGSKDQQTDYILGLLFAGCFVIAFFLAWTVLVAVFKCLGPRKVGFLSGQPFSVPYESKRPRRVRITFIVSAVILIIFSVLLVTEGLTQIRTGVGSVYESSVGFSNVVMDASALVNTVQILVDTRGLPLREEMLSELQGEFCISNSDLEAITGIDFSALTQNVSDALDALDSFYQEDLDRLNESFAELDELSRNVEETSDAITLSSWQSLIFIIPFPIFCIVLVAGVLLAWCDRSYSSYTWSLSWVVLPLFVILVIVCYTLCGAIAIGASANADFCSGGTQNTPQETILEIMLLNGHSEDDTVFQIIEYYVTTCKQTEGDPFAFMGDFKDDLEAAKNATASLDQAIGNVTAEELTDLCGDENYAAVQALMDSMETTSTEIARVVARFLDLVQCERLLPLFTHVFWDGTCQYSVQGATWTFASFLVIGLTGMLMISFRSSWLLVQDSDVDKVGADHDLGKGAECFPSTELSRHDGAQESFSMEQSPIFVSDNGDVEVVTGIEGGIVVGASAAQGAITNYDRNDANEKGCGQGDSGNSTNIDTSDVEFKTAGTQGGKHGAFDDSNWFDDASSPANTQN